LSIHAKRKAVDVTPELIYEKLQQLESVVLQQKAVIGSISERVDMILEMLENFMSTSSTAKGEQKGARVGAGKQKMRGGGKKAIDVLAEQGYIFASEMKVRNDVKARIIDAIRRSGRAIVIEGSSDTLLIHKDYLDVFLEVLNKKGPDSLDDKQKKLFDILTKNNLIERKKHGYVLTLNPE
jgi:ribosomal protein L36